MIKNVHAVLVGLDHTDCKITGKSKLEWLASIEKFRTGEDQIKNKKCKNRL